MRALPHVSLILGMAFFMAADDAKKKKQSDYDKLQGVWVTGESWKDGEREAKDAKEPEVYRFVNRTVEFGTLVRGKFVSAKNLGPFTGPLKLDESKSPKIPRPTPAPGVQSVGVPAHNAVVIANPLRSMLTSHTKTTIPCVPESGSVRLLVSR